MFHIGDYMAYSPPLAADSSTVQLNDSVFFQVIANELYLLVYYTIKMYCWTMYKKTLTLQDVQKIIKTF